LKCNDCYIIKSKVVIRIYYLTTHNKLICNRKTSKANTIPLLPALINCKKFTFKPNVLFIYHLGEDSFENIFGQSENIKNSNGLTINGNLITSFAVSKQSSLELSLATPFVVRDIRPDGLTRSFVLGLQYQYSF